MKLGILFALVAMGANAANYYVTIAGLGGEEEYEQRFTGLAKEIDKLLKTSAGGGRVETLFGAAATKASVSAISASANERK